MVQPEGHREDVQILLLQCTKRTRPPIRGCTGQHTAPLLNGALLRASSVKYYMTDIGTGPGFRKGVRWKIWGRKYPSGVRGQIRGSKPAGKVLQKMATFCKSHYIDVDKQITVYGHYTSGNLC